MLDFARIFLTGLSRDTAQAVRELAGVVAAGATKDAVSLLDRVRALSAEEARELASIAMDFVENEVAAVHELGIELLHGLACFRFEPLRPDIIAHYVTREFSGRRAFIGTRETPRRGRCGRCSSRTMARSMSITS